MSTKTWRNLVIAVCLMLGAAAPAQNGFITVVGRASFERNKWFVSTADRLYLLKVTPKHSVLILTRLESSKFKTPYITLDGHAYRTESENILEVYEVGPVVERLPP